jgi:hypothetical protein
MIEFSEVRLGLAGGREGILVRAMSVREYERALRPGMRSAVPDAGDLRHLSFDVVPSPSTSPCSSSARVPRTSGSSVTERPGMDSTMPVDPSATVEDALKSKSGKSAYGALDHWPFSLALLLLRGRSLPETTFPPAKQHFVNCIEILRHGTLLLPKFFNLDILHVEPATVKHEPFIPSFLWHAFALFVDVKVVFFLVPDEDKLTATTHAHNRDGKRLVGRDIG